MHGAFHRSLCRGTPGSAALLPVPIASGDPRVVERVVDRGPAASLQLQKPLVPLVAGPGEDRIPAGRLAVPTPRDRIVVPALRGRSPNR